MSRKKLTNNEKFVFTETEFVNPPGNHALIQQSSVQKRLFPKAEANKPQSNPPPSGSLSSPCNPIGSIRDDGIGLGGDHGIKKKDLTTDPCVDQVVAKLAMLNTESLRITVNVNENVQIRTIQMFPTNPRPPVNSKKVLLQVVPKTTSQEGLHPFKADYKKIDISMNNNSVLNNNESMETSTSNGNATAIKSKPALHTWKPTVTFKCGSSLSPPASAGDETMKEESISVRNVLQNDEDSCICVRPPKLILCPVCSYATTGRLRKTCQVHPKDVYLLDLDACPRCKETSKFMLREYDLPKEFKQFPIISSTRINFSNGSTAL